MSHQDALHNLIPVNTLTQSNFRELAAAAVIEQVPAKTVVFREGDKDNQSIYLLEGEVLLKSSGKSGAKKTVAGGSDDARYALSQLKPRRVTGITVRDSTIARIDSALLDRLLTWDQVSGIEVVEMDGDEDAGWMLQVLRSDTFGKLPPANANEMFARMEAVPVKAHDIIVRQGDRGDYYYLIREGKCAVSQQGSSGKIAIVNQLAESDQFGEEALISDEPRNATIVMLTDGVLMRLARSDFLELLKEPLIKWVDNKKAKDLLAKGAGLLDVRTEAEFGRGALRNARNVPLYRIRQVFPKLEPGRKYIIYCQTGSRSAIAAFMLNQRGFDAYALKGGLAAVQKRRDAANES